MAALAGGCHCGAIRFEIDDSDVLVARYRSSSAGQRGFCPNCGTQLFYAPGDGSFITLNATGVDRPETEALRPGRHIFTADSLGWFDTTDSLPRYPEGLP